MKNATIAAGKTFLLFSGAVLLALPTLPGSSLSVYAQGEAMGRMIEIFVAKGMLDPDEAEKLQHALAEDRRQMLEKENVLKKKEEDLRQWERLLKEKKLQLDADEKRESPQPTVSAQPAAESSPLPKAFSVKKEASPAESDDLTLSLKGLLQADYRKFDYDGMDANRDRFDIRRARFGLGGKASDRFDYYFLYEFQGAGSRRLLDAYVDAHLPGDLSLRAGQFKEPFGLEQTSSDGNLFFAERSMGFYLTPGRDLGIMGHGSLWNHRIRYGIGIFSGDGFDDAAGGDADEVEWTGRVVFSPFRNGSIPVLQTLHFGGSLGFARVDRTNVDIHVKTAGLTSFFDVASMAKFNVIRDVERRSRHAAEFAWTFGPVLLAGEYIRLAFDDIGTSSERFDTQLEDRYISMVWMLTGEKPELRDGVFQAITPLKPIGRGGWGGLGLALRYDEFEADESAYDNLIQEGASVREAMAVSVAFNWYLDSWSRIILDATRTTFDRPLLIKRDSLTGVSLFSDREDVYTLRYQFRF